MSPNYISFAVPSGGVDQRIETGSLAEAANLMTGSRAESWRHRLRGGILRAVLKKRHTFVAKMKGTPYLVEIHGDGLKIR